jgi:putative membrane protein
MSVQMPNPSEPQRKPSDTLTLAADRTRLAYERTLMAWVRTSISLITFGFTIFKFFQIENAVQPQTRAFSATEFSLLMIATGLLALLIATLEHRRDVKELKAEFPHLPHSSARILAALISVLGIVALLTVLLRR